MYSHGCSECDFAFPMGGTAVMYAIDNTKHTIT